MWITPFIHILSPGVIARDRGCEPSGWGYWGAGAGGKQGSRYDGLLFVEHLSYHGTRQLVDSREVTRPMYSPDNAVRHACLFSYYCTAGAPPCLTPAA